ncbi:PorT family protein [Aureitalea sp. L0-47]|uniref:porin family protein n=1 Tax=Aureitalea sp. L0-47 TaxID=2816962 RepID=UPI0022386467|nr:porin family protein [Aureitalea sp. L0-47]MCW5520763.1 PorT family protein [Aureitalea sp. L0-47]
MKKILMLAAIAVFSLATVQAQGVSFGAKAGVNFATIGGDETDDIDGRTGFYVGGVVEIPVNDFFSVQPEVVYSAQGAKTKFSETILDETFSGESTVKLDYINIPIIGKFYVVEGLSLEAGPQIGFNINAMDEFEVSGLGMSESGEEDISEFVSGTDFAIAAGASYKLPNGLFFSARYNVGLSDINDDPEFDDISNQNNVIQLGAGFLF